MAEKILIADDEESLVEFIGRALKKAWLQGNNGPRRRQRAFSLIGEELPDLVILDLMMPQMDGWEVCRRAKTGTDYQGHPYHNADCKEFSR
jgi:Response regulators consisting of a CheY-like receiver domain and a winged-helix DNA-binding domain